MCLRKLRDAELKGKKVLMRVDFNVPMDKSGHIIDDTKIRAAIPTINYVLEQGASIVLMSHLGRPDGKPNEKYSLKNVAAHLKGLVSGNVYMAADCIGPEVQTQVNALKPGQILMLENVRFHPEEEKNDPGFSRQLAALGELFVNDAFGSAHRAHSSTAGVAAFLPAYAGFLLEKEVTMLRDVLENPQRPRMAILGGAKVADKLGLIHNLLGKMDDILIGGGMANTFLKAQNREIGKSLVEDDLLGEARRLLDIAEQQGTRILLPVDVVVAREITPEATGQVVSIDQVPADMMILDIGPQTIEEFTRAILAAKTVVWNGPLGVYEYEQFAAGTRQVAEALAHSRAVSVIGGGDSAAAVHDMGLEKSITHISTGGGATLEYLEGLQLPGVVACEGYAPAAR
ncbi:MAG TPA: phosphoglycerate kinase [Syntrophomonadaceae bacterium]|nr:phosphoglycerate kinase [Syntrophomonadaceae bacterium]